MKNIITLFLAVSILSLSAQTSNIEGFRSFTWGQELTEMKIDGEVANFIKIDKDLEKDGDYYILTDENLLIGNVLLKNIEYVFSKKDGKFYKVVLTGKKEDVEQMSFIVDYKYGDSINEDEKDNQTIKQWLINNVNIILKDYTLHKFELMIESNWEAAEAFRKNTSVDDF